MARVSLILPVAPGCSPSEGRIEALRRGLESQGHWVEVVEVVEGQTTDGEGRGASWRVLASRWPGLASAAVAGIDEAEGDLLVILDPARDDTPEDMGRLLEPLIHDRADVVVARRVRSPGLRGLATRGIRLMARPLVGTSEPLTGLIALSRRKAMEARDGYRPVGSLFALELLINTAGRRVEVPIEGAYRTRPERLTLDEVRHIKRLADSRFGNASRLIQFCLVGASGMVVDLSSYALFQLIIARTWLAGRRVSLFGGAIDLAVDLAAAAAPAIVLAMTWNFTLNRRMTFSYAREGSLLRQYATYALSNALGIALSFSVRLILPERIGFFARHRLAAAFVGIVAATAISFSMSRWLVFSHRSGSRESSRREADPEAAEVDPLAPGHRSSWRETDRSPTEAGTVAPSK
jgi:dolichol-phosphate mannosyltransferase